MLTRSLDGSWPAACSACSSSCSRPTRGLLLPRQELREPVRITLSPPSVCVVQMPVRTSVLGLCLTQCCCTVVRAHPSRSRPRTPLAPGIPDASRPSIPLPQGGWWSDLVICSILEHGKVNTHTGLSIRHRLGVNTDIDTDIDKARPPGQTFQPGPEPRVNSRLLWSRIALAAPHWIP